MTKETFDYLLGLKQSIVETHAPCGGSGYLPRTVPEEENPCECMQVFMYLEDLYESRIPPDYWWLSLKDLSMKKEIKAVTLKYIRNLVRAKENALGMMFFGENGIGKTALQCEIGKEAIVQGFSVRYFTAQQYVDAKKEQDADLVTDYESGDFILLDELDKVYISAGTTYVLRTLEGFLRRVSSNGRCLIICSNMDPDGLKSVFGASTLSVLRRHLGFFVIEGTDYSIDMQIRWESLLTVKKSYFDPAILSVADRRYQRVLEGERNAWKKTY